MFLFSPYETGGLEISPFSKNKYREAVVFFAIDTQSTKHFASKNTVNNLIDQSSPINQVVKLPQKTKIIMLVGKKDITVPPKQSYIYFERAKKLKKNIYLHEVDAEHDTHQIDKKLRALVHELLD